MATGLPALRATRSLTLGLPTASRGSWYARLDSSHPALRAVVGATGTCEESAVTALLAEVDRFGVSWPAPPPRSPPHTVHPVSARVRLALYGQTMIGFLVASAADQLWVCWETTDHDLRGAWVPPGTVTPAS